MVNDQRKAVFEQRQEFMLRRPTFPTVVAEMRHDTIADLIARHVPPKAYADQWDIEGLDERVRSLLGLELPVKEWAAEEGIANEEIEERLQAAADARAVERERVISSEQTRHIEKNFLLQMVDMHWREHLMHLDHLRNVIGLRGYGQRDPLNEYKTEAFSLFEKLIGDLRQSVTRWMMTVEVQFADPEPAPTPRYEVHIDPQTGENERVMGDGRRRRPASAVLLDERASLHAPKPPSPPASSAPAATPPAPAAPAENSNTATERWSDPGHRRPEPSPRLPLSIPRPSRRLGEAR